MKLYYFDMKGRAETARLVMQLGGKEFEDVRFSHEEFAAKYKALSPSGQVPFLELDDGSILTQSAAISMYCAGQAGMMPSDPFQVARTVELINALEDAMQGILATFMIKDPEAKITARKALIESEGSLTKKMKVVEELVAACKTPFYCGDKMTLADCHLFVFVGTIRSGFLDGITKEFPDSFEKIAALRSKVGSDAKVKEIYASSDGFEP